MAGNIDWNNIPIGTEVYGYNFIIGDKYYFLNYDKESECPFKVYSKEYDKICSFKYCELVPIKEESVTDRYISIKNKIKNNEYITIEEKLLATVLNTLYSIE